MSPRFFLYFPGFFSGVEKSIFYEFVYDEQCGGFSLFLIRPELLSNHFFDIFSENRFFRFFSGVIYTKISGIFFR